jgi:hypothetical protein
VTIPGEAVLRPKPDNYPIRDDAPPLSVFNFQNLLVFVFCSPKHALQMEKAESR